jgi:hypothetical protein
MNGYEVSVFRDAVRVSRDGVEVAQAVKTGTGVFHAVCVGGRWIGYEHESGVTLDAWASRFVG